MLTYSSDACGDLAGQAPAAAAAAPQIIGQPVDQLVSAGDFASFSVVVAVTSGVTFQWAFDGTNIAGATGDSLLLVSVGAADAGQYSVTVTNSAGTVTSTPATLTLDSGASTPSPRLHLAAYSDAGGSVTVTPFQRGYGLGEPVTLTAAASAPSVFVGWSGISTGDLLATTSPVIVMMTADITVRARFAAPVPLAEGMVAFWRGENNATDLIGGYSGTFFTGTTPTAPSVTPWGKVGSAFAFTGTNYVQIADAPGLQPPQLTLEAWVFPTVLSSTSSQTVIGRGYSNAVTAGQWQLGVLNGIPQIYANNVGDTGILAGPAAIPLNEWTHLAATFDGATMALFVNGTQVASAGTVRGIIYAPVLVTIGADWGKDGPANLFTGFIDEVSLYDRALSADEIFDIYNADIAGKNVAAPYFTTDSPLPPAATNGTGYTQQLATVLGTAPVSFTVSAGALPPGMPLTPAGAVTGASTVPGLFDVTVAATDASGNSTDQLYLLAVIPPVVPPPGLVSWWRGEPTTSTVVLDSIDGNNGGFFTGTTATAPSYTPDGEVGGAFAFTGTNYVQIPDAPSLQPPQLTLETWVHPTVLSSFLAAVIGRGSPDSNNAQWWLGLNNGTPWIYANNLGGPGFLAAPSAIPLNEWTHLAVTFDGATAVLFVNGTQVASAGGLHALSYAPVPVTIGADWWQNGPANLFTGRIDEVSLYDRALTPAEISGIVAAGPAGKSTGPYITTGLLLPAAIVSQPYTQAFTSVLGTPPVSYTLGASTAAPPGLTLTSAGVLSGTPTASGVFGFTVVATDAAALSDQQPFTLQAYGQPVVTGISPVSGGMDGGVTVTVTGSGLTGATGVSFGAGAGAPTTILTRSGDTQLTATSPAATASGPVDVTVTGPGGRSATSAADQFTYLPSPVVTGISPASGPLAGGGTVGTVTVTGSGFTRATGVHFGSEAATNLDVASDTQLTVECPAATASGTVDVTVTTPVGTSATSAADQFTYLTVPVVTSISQSVSLLTGGGGMTVTGSGFTDATQVRFGSELATILQASDTRLFVTIPAATATGTVDVTVTNPVGTSATSAADQFTYLTVPVVMGISPASGPLAGGFTVTVTGTGFTRVDEVSFGAGIGAGGPATNLDVASDTQLTVECPAATATGTVDVTVSNPVATSATSAADQFTYN